MLQQSTARNKARSLILLTGRDGILYEKQIEIRVEIAFHEYVHYFSATNDTLLKILINNVTFLA